MIKRKLGRTGEMLSLIGFGGIVVMNEDQSTANSAVSEAVDKGINYFDVAPGYGDAELKLGPALEPYRQDAFLACKTGDRTKDGAASELRRSLERLKTDHLDLYQLHGMTSEDDFQKVMGPGGALEAFVEARDAGLVRYLGFSAHSVDIALKLIGSFEFDTVLFPINWVNWFNGNFGPQVIDAALSKDMGVLAIKAMAMTNWAEGEHRTYSKPWYKPLDNPHLAELALRFTLSQGVTAAVPPGDLTLFKMALKSAETGKLTPITELEKAELKEKALGLTPIFHL